MREQDSVNIAVWTAKSKKLVESTRDLLGKIGFDGSGLPQEIIEGK